MSSNLIGAGWFFCASHYDEVRTEVHGHSYEVMVWFAFNEPRDAMVLQEQVKVVCATLDHKNLPREMSRAEDMARRFFALEGVVEVEIKRPIERLAVRVRP